MRRGVMIWLARSGPSATARFGSVPAGEIGAIRTDAGPANNRFAKARTLAA
ncbi:hypothetical protein [Saccharopolyspora phatthalungensis]|uniref:Uncharacterized protein n=1 Tax=Saccharopolyspora phatthalungensis TaxID=664693 RepID=A0A840Q3D8_9PSEU|nr:hypothetical protein [Saccharopolyspora phatthalungensis]MBB5153219.1 hypothetical protein [Saccharopolyspora phatthalungensis]